MAVSAISGVTTATTETTSAATKFDKNAFLNLLISQLKYQDPLDPMKADQFMSQLAQMTQVEQLQNIAGSLDDMKKSAQNATPVQWISTIGKKINVDSNVLSKGDQVYLTPSGDFDEVLLTLKNRKDGSTTEVRFKKGDPLVYTYDGEDSVMFGTGAMKNNKSVGCSASAYRIVKGIQVDNAGNTLLVSGTGDTYSTDKVKQIKE